MEIKKLIKETRQRLGENQKIFGGRFGVGKACVSLWESGQREAGYDVIEFCLVRKNLPVYITCRNCEGRGVVKYDIYAD